MPLTKHTQTKTPQNHIACGVIELLDRFYLQDHFYLWKRDILEDQEFEELAGVGEMLESQMLKMKS